MTSGRRPFDQSHTDIGRAAHGLGHFTLAPLPAAEASRLGAAFAMMDPWARYPYPAQGLATYFATAEPGAPRLALMAGDRVAGVVGLRINWLRGPYLQFLGILPEFQRHGAGGLVLGWLEHEAHTAGERNLWVCASDFNASGIRFYQRHGFRRVADFEGLVRDGLTEVLLRKRLAPQPKP